MSAQAKVKCPICSAVKHVELQDEAPKCDNDFCDMYVVEVSS